MGRWRLPYRALPDFVAVVTAYAILALSSR